MNLVLRVLVIVELSDPSTEGPVVVWRSVAVDPLVTSGCDLLIGIQECNCWFRVLR